MALEQNSQPAVVTSAAAHGKIEPPGLASGEPLSVRITGAVELAGRSVSIILWARDTVSEHWIATLPADLDAGGSGEAELAGGLQVGQETAVWVHGVATEELFVRFEFCSLAIVDSSVSVTDANAVERFELLSAEREARYNVPIVADGQVQLTEHRALYIVDQLLVGSTIKLPGVVIQPIAEPPVGADFRNAIARAAEQAGWPGRPPSAWGSLYGARHPMVIVMMPRILAADYQTAGALADRSVDDVLDVFSIARGSRGVPVVSLLESLEGEGRVHPRFRFLSPGYGGNYATGPLAGESPHDLLRMMESLHADPRVRLCVTMYGAALAETDPDAKYYRFWSILELLSMSSVGAGERVRLEDGSFWPDGGTTDHAGPRVYALIQSAIGGINSASLANPAANLYELVRAWYGRRNATVHYGRFVVTDAMQARTNWYEWARRTVAPGEAGFDLWLRSVQEICTIVLRYELLRRRG